MCELFSIENHKRQKKKQPKLSFLHSTGNLIYDVALNSSPRVAENERPIALFQSIDAAMCNSKGVYVVKGNHYYHFESLHVMVAGRALPEQHRISVEVFGCDH